MNKIESNKNINCSFKFAVQSKLSKNLKEFNLMTSLFGRIIQDENHAFNELCECFFERPFSDIGTIFELFSSFLKETGDFSLFLKPLSDNRNQALLTPLQFMRNMIIENSISSKQLKKNFILTVFFELNEITKIFRLRHALKIFIEMSMALRSNSYIEEAENNLNHLDLFIYENVTPEVIANFTRTIDDDINNFVLFVEFCSWAVISNSFSIEKSKIIMDLIPENKLSLSLSKDSLGLLASAYCLLSDYKKAIQCLTLSFSSGEDSFIGWNTHALFKFFFGLSPEYHGIRIVPASHFVLEGIRINRNFRGRNNESENLMNKISLNDEEYGGRIIDFMDLKEDNNVVVDT